MPIPAESKYSISDVMVGGEEKSSALRTRPGHEFLLFANPENWEIGKVGGELVWLPELVERPVIPGVNCCLTLKQGEPKRNAYKLMVEKFEQWGDQLIPPDVDVDGHGGTYIRAIACQHPQTRRAGHIYMDRWSVPRSARPGKSIKQIRDDEGFNAWRLSLVEHGWVTTSGDRGRIKPPAPEAIIEQRDSVAGHMARHRAAVFANSDHREQVISAAEEKLSEYKGARVPEYLGDAVPEDHSDLVVSLLGDKLIAGAVPEILWAQNGIEPDGPIASRALELYNSAQPDPAPKPDPKPKIRGAKR